MVVLLFPARKALATVARAAAFKTGGVQTAGARHPQNRFARRGVKAALAGLGLLALAACDLAPSSGLGINQPGANFGPRLTPGAPVPVALLVPRSDAGAGAVAASMENAARLAMADLQNVQIDLRVYDTAGNAERASQVAQQAVDEGAKIVLGPLFGAAANAAGVAVADDGINVLTFSNTPSIAGGNVFLLGSTFANTADKVTSYLRRTGRTDLVVMHSENVAGRLGLSAVQTAAARNGLTVAGTAGYALNTQSLDAAMNRAAELVSTTGASTVMLTSDYDGALANALTLLPEKGVSPETTTYAGLTRWDSRTDAFQFPGLRNSVFAIPDEALAQAFRSRYQAAYGARPHPLSGLAYDGIAAIGALASQGRPDALTRNALTQSSGFQGVGGIFRLLPDGTNERGLAIATIRNNQVVILEAAPRGFRGTGL